MMERKVHNLENEFGEVIQVDVRLYDASYPLLVLIQETNGPLPTYFMPIDQIVELRDILNGIISGRETP